MGSNNIESIYKLSPFQEGILFHGLNAPTADSYFQQFSCDLDALESPARWKQAWSVVAARHPIMRTLFTWEKRDKPLQLVKKRVDLPWEYHDLTNQAEQQQNSKWNSLLQRDRDRGFELSKAPLIRFNMVRIGDLQYKFLWSFHHIILDGWSQRLLFDEAVKCYRDNIGNEKEFPYPAPPYSGFINWLDQIDKNEQELFWTKQLVGFKTPSGFSDLPRTEPSKIGEFEQRTHELLIDDHKLEKLKQLAKQENLTLNTLVVGAWALILGAYSNSSDVVFGTTVSGRSISLSDTNRIAGLFINTLPLRVKIKEHQSVNTWLKSIQLKQISLIEHEQTALVDIQRCSELTAGSPLFETILVFENLPETKRSDTVNDLPNVSNPNYTEFSHYPLAILADPSDGLKLIAVNQIDRISGSFARRLLEALDAVLEQISVSITDNVADIEVISRQDKQSSIIEWNETKAIRTEAIGIHQLFERVAVQVPESVALNYLAEEINYFDLNKKANQLAYLLRSRGIGEGTVVPVFMEQSIDTVICFLAVLKTGAAYIPLDTDIPRQRIDFVFEDIGALDLVILTHQNHLDKISHHQVDTICLDQGRDILVKCQRENLELPIKSSQLAYIIYTSGSTGRPKGVMIEHGGLVNSTLARKEYYPEQPSAFLLLSSFTTDSSVAGLYWTLISGGTLIITKKRIEQEIDRVAKLIKSNRVTHLLCIPSLYQLILENSTEEQLATLTTSVVAGESCSLDVVKKHQEKLPFTWLYNEYGPTECTVWATVAELSQHNSNCPISIGYSISNTQVYVLNMMMKPVPVGVSGELHIGGMSVARGYLSQDDKTALAFVDNPFIGVSDSKINSRLYKTGDRVRFLENGSLEFLGRVDNQIKLRGYRIEPEEIEKVISQHPSVNEAIVFIDRDPSELSEVMQLCRDLEAISPELAHTLVNEVIQLTDQEVEASLQL